MKKKREPVPHAVKASVALTLEEHTLLQIKDEDPNLTDSIEVVLRSDGARIATICCFEEESRTMALHVSPADFSALVERGRAHSFAASLPEDKAPIWTFREDPLLQIRGIDLDPRVYLEIVLRPDGVTFASSTYDHVGAPRGQHVRITPTSFQALIDRCRTHRFAI